MKINDLVSIKVKKRRLARGNAGKGGTTAGRGTKGQRSRTSRGNIPTAFEGGQTPLKARLPKKKGFVGRLRKRYDVINVGQISSAFAGSDKIDAIALHKAKLINSPKNPIKILAGGEINKKIQITAQAFSKSAIKKIEKAGGKIIIVK